MSHFLHFSEHMLQELALGFMALVYITRVTWFLRFKAGKERQAPTGKRPTSAKQPIIYSWANITMPWAMESFRRKMFLYGQFVLFHMGVATAIALSFVIPYGSGILENSGVVLAIQVVTGGACAVGVMRFIRRTGNAHMRALSSPDDYFSLILLTVWLFSAVLAAPNSLARGEWPLLAFFVLTAFFLIYVPFSKISHYLYYPFTRYYLGKTMGRRGVFPIPFGRRA